MVKKRIYLDWNATAPLLGSVRDAMLDALTLVGNPSSVHAEGRAARGLIEAARRDVALLVGVSPANVVFTATATEAANLVLSPVYRMGKAQLSIGHLYVSAIEHPAVRQGGRFAADQVSEIQVTEAGLVDLEALERLLGAHDATTGLPLVAVMAVNNETGVIQPIRDVATIVHAHGGLLVVDAVQAAGRMTLAVEENRADFLLLSAHKIGGPKGAGALVARGETLMPAPLIRGGGQEKGHRGGTENVAAIAGFGAAAAFARQGLEERNAAIGVLRDRLEAGMRQAAGDLVVHGADVVRVANTSFFTLPGLKAETGQIAFDLEGVALSAGAACSSGKVGASHVLTAMGQDAKTGALRMSLGPSTTVEEIDRVVEIFARIAARRKLSGEAA
ncbi:MULTISPECIES: cysteine desulfurase family protein [Alphaproteobacteria]|uniref:Cysteine desulfurase n=2 Tax=Alphaproteobacteria TaxID=28211 RepID=A0A512HHP4_9HYPH|nr:MULTISPECIES: cysteine desulfurase family protein [Alphaproteobacteria]GEO84972.1 cysteine desulfurase [Ciceribacter naphthalenivorans]GLR22906.1 cysteine desulfurase [Ciceribacter naphthalenivorans]GLT05762.1 cysteine desulfurase [Sphingomonas psychrolutea]